MSKITYLVLAASLLALAPPAKAQGTSGSTGAIASIPSSVVRAGEQIRSPAKPDSFSTFAQAGPCSEDIAQFEAAIRQSAGNPNAGLTARQSVNAQLDRQPTPASLKRANERLQAKFSANMARAKQLDAKGDRAGCERYLSAAKRMFIL